VTITTGVASSVGASTPTDLYVASTGTNGGSNTCQVPENPCLTIENAVTQAATITGAVVIEVGQGTYAEQVTIPPNPDGSYDPSSLTIEPNPDNSEAVLLQPTAVSANLPDVPTTNQPYDDFGGQGVKAIIGVGAPGTGDTYETGFATNVSISGLSITGGDFVHTYVAAIAYVNTSGTITGNAINDVTTDESSWTGVYAHGIDVRGVNPSNATTPSYSVTISDNTLGSSTSGSTDWAGHIPIDANSTGTTAAGSPIGGSLGALISGNGIFGTLLSSVPGSQNGIATGGLTSVGISNNTVQDLQSTDYSSGLNIGTQAPSANCSASDNHLIDDDYGVGLGGAQDCSVTGNTIESGLWGVTVNAVPFNANPGSPSPDNTVSGNSITGTSTVITDTNSVDPDHVPLDGVLVSAGPATTVAGNTISGYKNDVYVGADPDTFIYGSGPYSWSTTGTVVAGNDLGTLAGSGGFGVSHLDDPNTPASYALDAEGNWWGSTSGPSSTIAASTQVDTSNWCITSSPCASVPHAPVAVTASVAAAAAGAVQLSWTVPDTDGGSALTGYTVVPYDVTTSSAGPDQATPAADTQPITLDGLKAGDAYTFTLEAMNAVGTSVLSSRSNSVVPLSTPPSASSSASSSTPGGSASTSVGTPNSAGSVSATASGGEGTVTLSTYSSDPTAGLMVGGTYFDIALTPSSTFTSVTATLCGRPTASGVEWWDPLTSSYARVSDAIPTGTAGCFNVTFDASSTPSLSQLYGTVLALSSPEGYWQAAADGGIFAFGSARFYGSEGGHVLEAPVVGMATTPDGGGYWEVAADGGVFAFGDARFYGSEGGRHLEAPVVGMVATADGLGYWEVASDGGIFAFGDAHFYGSEGGQHLNRPVVGLAATADGKGYWLVASDGGIFAFGDATFSGSLGGRSLNAPVVGISANPVDDGGYWEVAADGGVFAFGGARFYGSVAGKPLAASVVGMAASPDGDGYWEVAADGGVFSYGDALFSGSMGGQKLQAPMVGITTVGAD
jgi:hypothetical protein